MTPTVGEAIESGEWVEANCPRCREDRYLIALVGGPDGWRACSFCGLIVAEYPRAPLIERLAGVTS